MAMERREAIKRFGAMLGVAITGPTLAGFLSGCEAGPAGSLRTLSATQHKLLDAMTEHIIPSTDSPGASAARVADYIDAMLTDFWPEESRTKFLDGLKASDALAKEKYGSDFLACSNEDQFAFLDELDAQAYPDLEAMTEDERAAYDKEREENGKPFFRRLKELTVTGYYTSEVGATQELHLNPMQEYQGDIPFSQVGKAWA